MLEAITYTARISYKVDGGTCIYKREYFGDVESATRWAFEHITEIALHWGEINPGGLYISATVETSNGSFSDIYEIKCGL